MKQKIEQMGFIHDKVFDWMLLEESEPLADLSLNFEVIPQEA